MHRHPTQRISHEHRHPQTPPARLSQAGQPATRCKCTPSFEASVWDPIARRKLRESFPSEDAAKRWQADTASGVHRGSITADLAPTVRDAGEC